MNSMHRYFIMLIIFLSAMVAVISPLSAQFAGGDGTAQEPWQIATPEHLDNVRFYPEDHFIQIADIDLLNWGNWESIGTFASFAGSFDGNSFLINNLTVNTDYNCGLFAHTTGATLKNITLEDVYITGIMYVGGLVSTTCNSYIENCSVEGYIAGGILVGGLVGMNSEKSIIFNCHSNIEVLGTGSYPNSHGGLVGINVEYGEVNNSSSKGNVIGGSSVGGLIGKNQGPLVSGSVCSYVNSSYSSVNVAGNNNVGGLVGSNHDQGIINNCYATGTVESYYAKAGGLVGLNNLNSEIINSYSSASVTGSQNVGGLVGLESYGGVTINSYWDIDIFAYDNGIGIGKTTFEMMQYDTYTTWDFIETWKLVDLNPYIRKHYPSLQWQESHKHNRISNAHAHVFKERNWHWRSFPRLEEQDDHEYTIQLLSQLEGIVTEVEAQDSLGITISMRWNGIEWVGFPIAFNSVKGYKLFFISDASEHLLYCTGQSVDYDTWITLEPPGNNDRENWIGYFHPFTQSVFDAFGESVMDQLRTIKTDEWSMHYLDGLDEWVIMPNEPCYTPGMVSYGKMYSVITRVNEPVTFRWNIPNEYIPDPRESVPKTEYFSFEEASDYESFFIENIDNDDDVMEVAVYAGDECVGASVFTGNYPLEILAYTNISHQGEAISFAIYREGQRGMGEKIRVPEVKDLESGEFSPRILEPGRQKFSIVRLGAGDYEIENIIEPEITLAQNYPNPVGFISGSRSNLTEIPFYVAEEREVTLAVYNIRGQRVKTLFKGTATAGKHSIVWNGLNEQNRPVGSGIYLYRLESGDQILTRKMLLIR